MRCQLICTRSGRRSGLDEAKLIAVQAEGCAPIAEAFEGKRKKVGRVPKLNTIAHAIENPYPPSGSQVLRKLRENGGLSNSPSRDDPIKITQKSLMWMKRQRYQHSVKPLVRLHFFSIDRKTIIFSF